ncbi:MAG: MFS transporter [Bacillota bacterium]|nr:MFS transporter [Bacillota bacterium]MDI7249498.1 MFS transporter [Bacillota bacterium]
MGKRFDRRVWILVWGELVSSIGYFAIWPFFSMYTTGRLGATPLVAGLMLTLNGAAGIAGQLLSGYLADTRGRRPVMLAGLGLQSLALAGLALARDLRYVSLLAMVHGLGSPLFLPAAHAVVADVTPGGRRMEAYGLLRVAVNAGCAIGALVGGTVAARSLLPAFWGTAVVLAAWMVIIAVTFPESSPPRHRTSDAPPSDAPDRTGDAPPSDAPAPGSAAAPGAGYARVLADRVFVLVVGASFLTCLVYNQIGVTLNIFLRDARGIGEQQFGYLVTLNGLMVVLLQMPIARHIRGRWLGAAMAGGAALYAIGFAGWARVGSLPALLTFMAVVTLGEMVLAPGLTQVAADLAPPDLRARYLAFSSLSWSGSSLVAPVAGGALLGRYGGENLFTGAAALALVSALIYLPLNAPIAARIGGRPHPTGPTP